MIADPLQPVGRGDPLEIRAEAWNALTQLAKDDKSARRPQRDPRPAIEKSGVVLVFGKNNTGADLSPFKPVALDGVGGFDTGVQSLQWRERPYFGLDVFAAETDFVAVTWDAIPDGQIGRVAIAGAVLCDVDTSGGSAFATPVVGDADRLAGGTSGPVRILHTPSGVGSTKRCVVTLSGQSGEAPDSSIDGGGPGIDAAGFTDICKVTSGGNVTDIKLRRKYGRMFRCVSVDECCLSAWWCVANSQVTLTTACCTPATITRIIRLAFTSKTGDCTDLPDLVYLVHTGGTDLTWTNGTSADFWGIRTYSATFTISCSGATPKGTLTITDFTGGSITTIPCDLTSTGVALGTFTYSGTETDSCGNTTALSGTVAIAVSSWEDGGGVATTGVVEFGEDEVPPWDATGPYKTEAEADACCVLYAFCSGFESYRYKVNDTLELSIRNSVGNFTNVATSFSYDGSTDGGDAEEPTTILNYCRGLQASKIDQTPGAFRTEIRYTTWFSHVANEFIHILGIRLNHLVGGGYYGGVTYVNVDTGATIFLTGASQYIWYYFATPATGSDARITTDTHLIDLKVGTTIGSGNLGNCEIWVKPV